jgi:hypothetical protein
MRKSLVSLILYLNPSLDKQLTLIILDRLIEEWTSPVYAFFGKIPNISYVNGCCVHEFRCSAKTCKAKGVNKWIIRRYLDTTDCRSTSNLKCHAITCWGADNVDRALEAKVNIEEARVTLAGLKDGSITAAFERTGKAKVSYSHQQHTKPETRYESNPVKFVIINRPSNLVRDADIMDVARLPDISSEVDFRPSDWDDV